MCQPGDEENAVREAETGPTRTRCLAGERTDASTESSGDNIGSKRLLPGSTNSSESARGQTTFDYLVGISVLLLTLLFVFAFVPGILEPFTGTTQEEPVVANRIANQLAQGTLGSSTAPYVLDRQCTVRFFSGASPGSCQYSGGTLEERVGVSETQNLNVTLQTNLTGDSDTEIACWDDSNKELVPASDSSCDTADTAFTAGGSPGNQENTVTAERTVSLRGQGLQLRVVTW